MAAQITGADKVLEWTDLPTRNLTAPGEDDEADAAFTNAIFRFTQQPKISWVAGTKPYKYQIEDNFNMVVELITSGGGRQLEGQLGRLASPSGASTPAHPRARTLQPGSATGPGLLQRPKDLAHPPVRQRQRSKIGH